MIQIELPCCDTMTDLPPHAETIRCEACAVEHRLAPEACPVRGATDDTLPAAILAIAA